MRFKLLVFVCSFLSIFNINCMTFDDARLAAGWGDTQKLSKFLNDENDVNSVIGSLLHHAVNLESEEAVEMLLSRGAFVDISVGGGNWTPLHRASQLASFVIMELLLRNGANPNALTDEGDSPLHILLFYDPKFAPGVKLLLKYKADPSLLNAEGKKPADYAKDKKIIDLLNAAELDKKKEAKEQNESTAVEVPHRDDEKGRHEIKTINEQLLSKLQDMRAKINASKNPLKRSMITFIDEVKAFVEKMQSRTDLIIQINKLLEPIYKLIMETDLNDQKTFEDVYRSWITFTNEYQKIINARL